MKTEKKLSTIGFSKISIDSVRNTSTNMPCEYCQCLLSSNNYAVVNNNHYCLSCLSTNSLLCSNKESSNNQLKQSLEHKMLTKQCRVCFEDKSIQDFNSKYSSQCLHTVRSVCDSCVYRNMKQAFCKMCTDDVHCPEANCSAVFDYQSVIKLLSDNKDSKVLEKYDRFILHRILEKMKEFIWCAHGCGTGQLNDGGHRNNIVTCVKCHRKTCFTHKTEWHEGLTCNE